MSVGTPEPSPGQVTETGAAPDRQSPEARNDLAALPIARRLARTAFPLWWRPAARDERMPMVGWFDPGQLWSTGLKSLVSLFVGEQSDRRIVQALAARRQDTTTTRFTTATARRSAAGQGATSRRGVDSITSPTPAMGGTRPMPSRSRRRSAAGPRGT